MLLDEEARHDGLRNSLKAVCDQLKKERIIEKDADIIERVLLCFLQHTKKTLEEIGRYDASSKGKLLLCQTAQLADDLRSGVHVDSPCLLERWSERRHEYGSSECAERTPVWYRRHLTADVVCGQRGRGGGHLRHRQEQHDCEGKSKLQQQLALLLTSH